MSEDIFITKARGIGGKREMDAEVAAWRAQGKTVVVLDRVQQEACDHPNRYEPRGIRNKNGFRTWSCPDCHKQWDEWDEEDSLVWKMVRGLGEPGDFERWRELVIARSPEEV